MSLHVKVTVWSLINWCTVSKLLGVLVIKVELYSHHQTYILFDFKLSLIGTMPFLLVEVI